MKVNASIRCVLPPALLIVFVICLPGNLFAEVRVPNLFTDHMVLQQGTRLPVWGWANPGEVVHLSIADQAHEATADEKGRWSVELSPLAVGGPLTMTVTASNSIEIEDVLVGEVWLCSGQSNMRWPMSRASNPDLEIPKANHPNIRLLTVATEGSQTPVDDVDGVWQTCSPESVENFSAVGYHFGLELHERLEVPVGLINNAWSGSSCEAWTPRGLMENDPLYADIMREWRKIEAEYDVAAERQAYEQALKRWKQDREAGRQDHRVPRPRWVNQLKFNHRPGNLFNGRLEPVTPFGIRGVIWFQGEANIKRAAAYRELFPMTIRAWRQAWGQGDFPFYWAQLADFGIESDGTQENARAELREAQTLTLDREPNTGQAVAIDLGEGNANHPRRKDEVGRRLVRLALAKTYGVPIDHLSPRYKEMRVKNGVVTLRFSDCGEVLRTFDSDQVLGFVVAGEDCQWRAASARIVGVDQVIVKCDAVPQPVAVRYAWAGNPRCNVITQAGLPLTPFRTDDWPGKTDKR